MAATLLISITIQIILFIFAFFIIRYSVEQRVVNKKVLKDIKNEVNSMIKSLNDTTVKDISLIEEKIERINALIILADKKISTLEQVEIDYPAPQGGNSTKMNDNGKINTYSVKNMVKQTQKQAEIKSKEKDYLPEVDISDKDIDIHDEIEGMNTSLKVDYLLGKGKTRAEIKEITGLSNGELEVIMNILRSQL